MNFSSCKAFVGLLLAGAVIALAPRARADSFTYTYTGNPFTTFDAPFACSSGVGECSIDASFTLSSALAANLNGDILDLSHVSNFTVTDGNTTQSGTFLELNTDATGAIVNWEVEADYDSSNGELASFDFEADNSDYSFFVPGFAQVNGDPGTWVETSPSSAVPEPASLALLGTGMLGLLGLACLRRHAA